MTSARRKTPVSTALGILLLLMFAGFAIGASALLGFAVSSLAAGNTEDALLAGAAVHQVFLSVFFLIVITPILGFRGNEFLDVTKLFTYPVGHRTVFASTLLGLMGSGAVMFFCLPVFATVVGYVIGTRGSVAAMTAGIAVGALLMVVAVALGQFLLLAFLNTLKSRKWRDASMVLVPLIFGGAYVAFQILSRRAGDDGGMLKGAVRWFAVWKDWTLPLPSWWAAHAVTGSGWARFLPVLALAGLLAWLVRASAVLQERAYYGEIGEDVAAEAVRGRGVLAKIASRIRDPLGALVEKELAILKREPAVRSILIGQAMYPVLWGGLGVWRLVSSNSPAELGRYAPLAGLVAYPLLLMELGLVMNLLGLEGGGAVHAMLLPVKRRLLLLGKDVAYLLVFGTLNAVVAIVATVVMFVVTHAGSVADCVTWSALGALEGYCVVAVGLGIGNVMSVISPVRVAVRDRRAIRQQVGGRDGCVRGLVGLAAVFGTLFIAAPVAVCFHLPYALSVSKWADQVPGWTMLVTVPLAVLLSFGGMLLGAALGGRMLQAREEDIVGRLAKSDE